MKRIIKYFTLCIFTFLLGFTIVNAQNIRGETYNSNDISNETYIIGTHMFDRKGNDVYDGSLRTQYIMLASKTIQSSNVSDMIIYYKSVSGTWIDALTGEQINVPKSFEITHIDLIPIYDTEYIDIDVESQDKYIVLPKDGTELNVEKGKDFAFKVELKDYYRIDNDNFKVKSNGVVLNKDSEGYYTITNVTETPEITIEGIIGYTKFSIDPNGGSTSQSSINVDIDEEYTLPDSNVVTAPTGKVFDRWEVNGVKYAPGDKITVTGIGETKVKPSWKNVYTVSFNTNGGNSINSQNIIEGNKVVKPNDPVKDGYTFAGWYTTNENELFDFNSAINSNMTLNALWTQEEYIIEISLVDNYSPDMYLKVYKNGEEIEYKYIQTDEGFVLSYGTSKVANKNDISGKTKLNVVLLDDTIVTANIK